MLPEPLRFNEYQTAFAARIRDPNGAPRPPGAPAQRMRVYEELLYNNLEGFLLACYPVTRKLLGKRLWTQTVRRFFREHRCHSPLFRDIPKAFLDWLESNNAKLFPTLPFLQEFMHYEWLELGVSITPDEIDPDAIKADGDLLSGQPALNPTARLACYHYPVHQISPGFKPGKPDGQTWCYLLHRDAEDAVRFTSLNAVSARLIEVLQQSRLGGREALSRIAAEIGHPQPDTMIDAGHQLLRELSLSGAVVGTWR